MKMVIGGLCVLLSALTTHGHALKSASSCESLSSQALPNTSITLAQVVPAGAFTLPATGPATPQLSQLATFCRVVATLTPSSDSDIKIEVWLPILTTSPSRSISHPGPAVRCPTRRECL
jgi:feruloyl esterase